MIRYTKILLTYDTHQSSKSADVDTIIMLCIWYHALACIYWFNIVCNCMVFFVCRWRVRRLPRCAKPRARALPNLPCNTLWGTETLRPLWLAWRPQKWYDCFVTWSENFPVHFCRLLLMSAFWNTSTWSHTSPLHFKVTSTYLFTCT